MIRSAWNFIIDTVSFINLAGLAFTGTIMKYVLPPGSGGHGFRGGRAPAEVKVFWQMTRHEWGDIHFYLAVLFVSLMIVHIVLHWSWIKNCYKFFYRCPGKDI